MGAADVRHALTEYIRPTPGITAMFRDEPWMVTGEAWTTEDGLPGTVCYLHINEESETRITMTGRPETGKRVDYKVGIIILYQYIIPDAPVGNDAWIDGLDQLIDDLKARLRADPTMGTNGNVIWQAGQSDGDLRIRRDLPKLHHGKVHSWNVLELEVTEMLTS